MSADIEFEFDWEVLETFNTPEKRGALVKYTPVGDHAKCEECDIFVAVPWHKCISNEHMLEILEKKVAQRAPRNHWLKEITPAAPDVSEELLKELNNGKRSGQQRRKPRGNTDGGGSAERNSVSE